MVQNHGHGGDKGRGRRWDVFDECRYDGRGVGGVGCGGGWRRDQHAVMKVRRGNGKWLRTWDGRTVGIGWVDIVLEFSPRV